MLYSDKAKRNHVRHWKNLNDNWMVLEAYSLYLIYDMLPAYGEKVVNSLILDGLLTSIGDEDTKEGQIDILILIAFSLIFQIIGTLLT